MRTSKLIHTLSLALLAVGAATAPVLAAPPEERVQPDLTLASSGVVAGVSSWRAQPLNNGVVLLGSSSSVNSSLYAWTNEITIDGLNAWTWKGLVTAPGLPAAGPVSAANQRLATDGRSNVVWSRNATTLCVARRTPTGWVNLGSITLTPSTWPSRIALSGDTLATLHGTTVTIRRRLAGNTWTVASTAQLAQFGLLGASSISLDNGVLVVSGTGLWQYGLIGPGQTAVAAVSGTGVLSNFHAITLPAARCWRVGPAAVAGNGWIAVDVQPLGAAHPGLSIYQVGSGGVELLRQPDFAQTEVPLQIASGHMVTTEGVWSVDTSGLWHRGAQLPRADAMLCGDQCAVLQPGPALSVWTAPFDCNGDGQDDAIQLAQGLLPDCNANGRPDACDISAGLLPDANHNGIPDPCESDCDGNGIPDLTQIRSGAPTACGSSTALASCAIAGGATDSNSDGIVDACGPDLDGNGIPDAVEIAAGTAADCNHDGLPDTTAFYRLASPANVAWQATYGVANRAAIVRTYATDPGHRWITGIGFGVWGPGISGAPVDDTTPPSCVLPGQAYAAFVAADPNGDGLMDDAELLWFGTGVFTDEAVQQIACGEGVRVDAPAFFVGLLPPALAFNATGGSTACNGWLGTSPCSDGQSAGISSADCGQQLFGTFSASVPVDTAPAITGFQPQNFQTSLVAYSSRCTVPGDLSGDGVVDGTDLGLLLGAWGPAKPGAAEDLDHNGAVDGTDLGLLLGLWG
ncbi:MAG: hypothetical protein U0636_10930 [Phycisphaerales bacterium]